MSGRIMFEKGDVVNTGQKALSETAVQIFTTDNNIRGLKLSCASAFYIGDSNVNPSNGFLVPANVIYDDPFFCGKTLYAVVASGTPTLTFLYYTKTAVT